MSDANTSQGGPKALRIGVIQGVRVIEERILPRKGAVTFGSADGNTFTFSASDLPKSVTVFELKGDAYELVIDESMQGRLESPEGKQDFSALKASTTKQGNAYRVPLGESSKGRVRLSPEITVLFHFVAPPPVEAAAPMPPEVSQGLLKSVEPIFTAVLTASFLVHFGFGIFIKFTEPPAPPTVDDLKQLVERIRPPKVETKVPPPKPPTTTDTGKEKGTGKPEPDSGGGKKEPTGGGEADGGKKEPAGGGSGKAGGGSGGVGNREAIRQGIAGKGILQLIGGRGAGGGGGAAGSVFGSGGSISDDIGNALAGTAGVGIAGGAGGGDGITRRGSGGGGGGGDGSGGIGGAAVGIGDLHTGGGGTVDTGTKQATKVVARVQADDIEAVDGKIDKNSVAATIRRRQDGFQGCYETALKANSKLAGKLVVEFTIGDDGKVTEARVVKDGVGSGEVSSCVVGLLKRLKFPAPADGEVTISNTFVFQPGG